MSSSGCARRFPPTRWRPSTASRSTAPSAACWARTSRSGSPPGTRPTPGSGPSESSARSAPAAGAAWSALVGVQTNQFPRAVDIARPLRAAGVPVCIGGFHVSGCLAMLPDMPADLRAALDLGITLFAGEAEGRLDDLLRDAYARQARTGLQLHERSAGPRRRTGSVSSGWTWFAAPAECAPASTPAAAARSCAASARSSTCRGGSRAAAAPTTSSASCAPTWRRASTASSSPTTTSRAIRTGRRSSTG